jgi:hypothetical protein
MRTSALMVMAGLVVGCAIGPHVASERGDHFFTEHVRDTQTVAECLGRYLVDIGTTNAGQVSAIQAIPGAKRVSFERTSYGAGEVLVKATSRATRAEWHVDAGFPSGHVQADMKRLHSPCL